MTQQNVSKLKELLFDRESREIVELKQRLETAVAAAGRDRGELARRLDQLAERAGGDAQFQKSVAKVLDGAIRDAETERHNELSQALAPMVRRTFRAEIKSETTQEELTQSLYPKMGDMIRRYIASAMRDMMETINRRLESGLTNNSLALKIRSIATGRSMAELALADTERFTVEELYLIRRGSGELIHRWSRDPDALASGSAAGNNRDTLISGFLTAITSFAEEAFATDKSSLRSLDLDDHRIYLRASPAYLLAAKCKGSAAAAVEEVLDAELLHLLEDHQALETTLTANGARPAPEENARGHQRILGAFSEHIEQKIGAAEAELRKSRGGLRPLKIALLAIGLPIALYAGWQSYVTWQTDQLQAAADKAVADMPDLGGYPVKARVERGGNAVWVSGLVPTDRTRAELLGRINEAVPNAKLTEAIGVLPQTDVRTVLDKATLQRAMDGAQRRLEKVTPELEQKAAHFDPGPQRSAVELAVKAASESSATVGAAATSRDFAAINARLHEAIGRIRTATRQIAELTGTRQADVNAANAPLPATPAESADELAIAAERLAASVSALEQFRLTARVDEMARRLEGLKPPTAEEALLAYARAHAIFFGNALDLRDAPGVGLILDDLVALARKTSLLVRVVGYTDEVGGAGPRNLSLSQQRADRIAEELAVRGFPRNRIVAVGRGAAMEVAPRTGVTSANRRVEFEIGFPGEEGGSP